MRKRIFTSRVAALALFAVVGLIAALAPSLASLNLARAHSPGGASLTALTVTADGTALTLEPAFNSTVYSYTVHVDNSVAQVTVAGTPDDDGTVTADQQVTLPDGGATSVDVVVTHTDSGTTTTQTYTVLVIREGTMETDRAALMALYNATGGANWYNNTNWGSAEPIYTWYGVELKPFTTTSFEGRVLQLDLNENNLVGTLPASLGNLDQMGWLYLYGNQLTGTIPDLSALTNLKDLYLNSNQLTGTIPPSLGSHTLLIVLSLWGNQLTGEIPDLSRLTSLTHLWLGGNQLTGEIPDLGSLTSLLQLSLYDNQLSGRLPTSLGNLISLKILDLKNNQLSGTIPSTLGNLRALTHLYLYNNALLEGPLPTSFATLSALQELHVQNTQVTATDAALETWLEGRTVTTGTRESIRTIPLDAENTMPRGMWSDDTTLWVADYAGDKLYAYTLATGRRATTQDVTLDADNTGAQGLWSDGTTLWVSDFEDNTLYAYDLTTRSRDATKDMAVLAYPRGLWGNETTLWVANWQNIYAYSRSNGSRDTSKDITPFSANNFPRGLWSDGTTLWSPSDRDDARLYAYDLATGQHDPASYRSNDHILDPANANPQGLWSDGTTLWVNDSVQHKVYAYRNQEPQAVGGLPAQKLAVGGVAQTLLVTSAFRDPDGDALTYTAASLNEAVATVTVSEAEVSVQPGAVGTATITVTATDADGSEMPVTQSFEVSVVDGPLPNQEPQAVGGLPTQKLAVGEVQMVPVTSAFRDPDGDELTYAVTSSNTRIATARIVSQNAEEGASRATTRSSDTRIAAVQGAEVAVEV